LPKTPSARTAISSRIARDIRELISRGTLWPGVHLGQSELAERFGVSRVPVREALKLLDAEGIVFHDPNRGFFIAHISSNEARQLYRMRHLLEMELLSSLEWPDEAQLQDLRQRLEQLERFLKEGKGPEWTKAYREFHAAIFKLSPFKVILNQVLRLVRLTDRYRSLAPINLALSERTVDSERHLVLALATRDRSRLIQCFEEERARITHLMLKSLEARNL
jgi:DNA-binding GntR family transcriptional regulator